MDGSGLGDIPIPQGFLERNYDEDNRARFRKEYLNMVPEYNGEPELLSRFINACERLIVKFHNTDDPDCFENVYLLDSLLSKIRGPASVIVFSNPTETWGEVRDSLLNNFGDRRDSATLTQELCAMKQKSGEDGYKFYERLNNKLQTTLSKLRSETDDAEERAYNTNYIRKLGLRCLLKGFEEPLGSFMRTKNPTNMAEAARILINDYSLLPTFKRTEGGYKTQGGQKKSSYGNLNNSSNQKSQGGTPSKSGQSGSGSDKNRSFQKTYGKNSPNQEKSPGEGKAKFNKSNFTPKKEPSLNVIEKVEEDENGENGEEESGGESDDSNPFLENSSHSD